MKNIFVISILVFLVISCKKGYHDYNPKDFYEVQGIVTGTRPTSDPFDSYRDVDIWWEYHFDRYPPLKGSEKNIDLFIYKGSPIVVLVHKDDINVSFFGRLGFANDSIHREWLKEKSKKVLSPR